MCPNANASLNRVLSGKIISCIFNAITRGGIPYSAGELFHAECFAWSWMLARVCIVKQVVLCRPRVYPFMCVLVRHLRLDEGWSTCRTAAELERSPGRFASEVLS